MYRRRKPFSGEDAAILLCLALAMVAIYHGLDQIVVDAVTNQLAGQAAPQTERMTQ